MYYVVGQAFDLDIEVGAACLLEGIGNLALAVPATAAGIGTFDYLTLIAAKGVDIPTDKATAYVLTMHALTVVPITLLGAVLVRPAFPGLFRGASAPRRRASPRRARFRTRARDTEDARAFARPRAPRRSAARGRPRPRARGRPASPFPRSRNGVGKVRGRRRPAGQKLRRDDLSGRERHGGAEHLEDRVLDVLLRRRLEVAHRDEYAGAAADEGRRRSQPAAPRAGGRGGRARRPRAAEARSLRPARDGPPERPRGCGPAHSSTSGSRGPRLPRASP